MATTPADPMTRVQGTGARGVPYTIDELLIAAMARELTGEVLVSSVTSLGALAAHLAKQTHAPDLAVLATPESGMEVVPTPTLTLGQFLTDAQRGLPLTMGDIFDAIFLDRFRIWINPAQIDQFGNVNITAIGDWEKPKVALVGSRGIPEDTSHLSAILYYVTDHSLRTVVGRVSFRSGAGYGPERDKHLGTRGAPTRLVTNLGVFGFDGSEHAMRAQSLHPGVTPDIVRERTGFAIEVPEDVGVTPEPTAPELEIIRSADPLGVRKLEFLQGHEAAERLVDIYERERQALRVAAGPVHSRGR